MGAWGFFRGPDINQGAAHCAQDSGAVLLDVRTAQEYAAGHIPASRNIPLDQLDQAGERIPDRDTPLYVYCLSGARSRLAAARLRAMGYTQVRDIGGINGYRGRMEA